MSLVHRETSASGSPWKTAPQLAGHGVDLPYTVFCVRDDQVTAGFSIGCQCYTRKHQDKEITHITLLPEKRTTPQPLLLSAGFSSPGLLLGRGLYS